MTIFLTIFSLLSPFNVLFWFLDSGLLSEELVCMLLKNCLGDSTPKMHLEVLEDTGTVRTKKPEQDKKTETKA